MNRQPNKQYKERSNRPPTALLSQPATKSFRIKAASTNELKIILRIHCCCKSGGKISPLPETSLATLRNWGILERFSSARFSRDWRPPRDVRATLEMSDTASRTKEAPASFESALAELETIVERMESGQLPLAESLAAYKRGAELLQYCQGALKDAQHQVQILERGVLKSFEAEDAMTQGSDELDEP